jgi:hypothetical protein
MAGTTRIDVIVERGEGVQIVSLVGQKFPGTKDNEIKTKKDLIKAIFPIPLVNNVGSFTAENPGEYGITWNIRGKNGSSIKVEFKEKGKLIFTLEHKKTKIKGAANAGTVIIETGEKK